MVMVVVVAVKEAVQGDEWAIITVVVVVVKEWALPLPMDHLIIMLIVIRLIIPISHRFHRIIQTI